MSRLFNGLQLFGLLVVLLGVYLAAGLVPFVIVTGTLFLVLGVLGELGLLTGDRPAARTRDDHERIP